MEALAWISAHWLDLLQSAGIITAFVFSVLAIRREAEVRRISSMFEIGKQHNAIWKELGEHPELLRITDDRALIDATPVTPQERRFVLSLILHLDGVHRAMKSKMFVQVEGLQLDIKEFFSKPIPGAVWQSVKPFQNKDFVQFVEESVAGGRN